MYVCGYSGNDEASTDETYIPLMPSGRLYYGQVQVYAQKVPEEALRGEGALKAVLSILQLTNRKAATEQVGLVKQRLDDLALRVLPCHCHNLPTTYSAQIPWKIVVAHGGCLSGLEPI